MKDRIRIVVIAFTVALLLSSPVAAKDHWVKVKSENFTLIGNANEKKIRRVATKMEQFRHVFKLIFPTLKFKSAVPIAVLVFKNEGSFRKYKSIKWAAGYFQSGEDINYIALHTGGEKEQFYSTIFHEYIHFLVNNNLSKSNMPPWFDEGIAEYYDQFQIKGDKDVILGALNQDHLRSLHGAKLIPFQTFFAVDRYSLHRQSGHGVDMFYAQSWAFVHYLILGNQGARRKELDLFLNELLKGTDPKDAFTRIFKTDFKSMEKELRKYVRKSRFKVSSIKFEKKLLFENTMQTSPLSEAESKAHLGDLLFHIRRYDDAEKDLTESLRLDPDNGFANATMGMVKLKQDKPGEALKYLERAIAKETADFRTYYQYASVLSDDGRKSGSVMDSFSSEVAAKMVGALDKSIALNPNFPPSYDLMARVSLITGNNMEKGIASLRKAIALSPGNQYYRLNLANLYLRRNEFATAIPIVESVYKFADDAQVRGYAESLLKSLNEMQRQLAEAKKNGYQVVKEENGNITLRKRGDDTPRRQPTDAEQAAEQRESLNRSINQSMRKMLAGEERILGKLSKIACRRAAVEYTVKSDIGVQIFTSKDFQTLELILYDVDIGNIEVGCDSIKKDLRAVITYRPNKKARQKSKGQIVSIEFVSEDFALIEPE